MEGRMTSCNLGVAPAAEVAGCHSIARQIPRVLRIAATETPKVAPHRQIAPHAHSSSAGKEVKRASLADTLTRLPPCMHHPLFPRARKDIAKFAQLPFLCPQRPASSPRPHLCSCGTTTQHGLQAEGTTSAVRPPLSRARPHARSDTVTPHQWPHPKNGTAPPTFACPTSAAHPAPSPGFACTPATTAPCRCAARATSVAEPQNDAHRRSTTLVRHRRPQEHNGAKREGAGRTRCVEEGGKKRRGRTSSSSMDDLPPPPPHPLT
ncbi:hypothetical protein B0H10DRAFT_2233661 [Mycena sp. CBHHK59/15]|nr:hypothetical protein B0H10DRAFT_2233661 [Mycena sp. CBHHK59/15]